MKKTLLFAAGLALAGVGSVAGGQSAKPANQAKYDPTILHVQVILDKLGFSPGVLDGRPGKSLAAALKGFQSTRGLPGTGKMDAKTLGALHQYRDWRPTAAVVLTDQMLAGPYFNPFPKDPAQQAKLPALGYRSPLEKLAEMFHTTPQFLVELNGRETVMKPGTRVVFPNAVPISREYKGKLDDQWRATLTMLNVEANAPEGAKVVVDKSDEVLRVFDKGGKLVAQFQATMGSEHDPLPVGNWKIQGADYNPQFHYNPDLFWDAKQGAKEALLPPGPNGPVGVLWLDLSKPHYGIHGTAEPSTIGRAESHGCIRLTNWDVARLSLMVKPGTPAVFQN